MRQLTAHELVDEAPNGRQRAEVEMSELDVTVAGLSSDLFTRSSS